MGAQSNSALNLRYEAVSRSISMGAAFRPAKTRVYANKAITEDTRLLFHDSLLESRLLYCTGVWEKPSSKVLAIMRKAYMAPLRAIAGMSFSKDAAMFSNLQVLTFIGRPPIEFKLSMARLKYLSSFVRNATPQLRRLAMHAATSTVSWISTIVGDLRDLWRLVKQVRDELPLPATVHDLGPWFDFIGANRNRWSNVVRKSVKAFSQALANPASQPNNIYNIVVRYYDVDRVDQTNKNISCDQCPFTCTNAQQLLSHIFNLHEYRNPIHLRMRSTCCLSCDTEFHARHRLYRHLTKRPLKNKKKSAYMELEPMPLAELEAIEAACPTVDTKAFPPPPVKFCLFWPDPLSRKGMQFHEPRLFNLCRSLVGLLFPTPRRGMGPSLRRRTA